MPALAIFRELTSFYAKTRERRGPSQKKARVYSCPVTYTVNIQFNWTTVNSIRLQPSKIDRNNVTFAWQNNSMFLTLILHFSV